MPNRRHFLQLFGAAAIAQAIPLNRVWSFPSRIVIPHRTYLVGQYANFVNYADLQLSTAIDTEIGNIAREVTYRLALTVSSLVAATADLGVV